MSNASPTGSVPAPWQLLHNPQSPDVYADGATGWFLFNGNLRITLESFRSDYANNQGTVERVVIGRLVMPAVTAEAMCRSILAFFEQQRAASSAAPPPDPQGKPTVQ